MGITTLYGRTYYKTRCFDGKRLKNKAFVCFNLGVMVIYRSRRQEEKTASFPHYYVWVKMTTLGINHYMSVTSFVRMYAVGNEHICNVHASGARESRDFDIQHRYRYTYINFTYVMQHTQRVQKMHTTYIIRQNAFLLHIHAFNGVPLRVIPPPPLPINH